ncbi:spheroidene monooxygenase [Limibacter armeniacum]|uniref:spheroidene monooxygenase n=1 Tax=Limibacter armeniacum TaxID=466084 RepID=UPI002FE642C5
MKQVVTITFFRFLSLPDQVWAFRMMGLGKYALQDVEGLTFCKLMGTGAKNGFSLMPDFTSYCLLCVWENQTYSEAFMANSSMFNEYRTRSDELLTIWMQSFQVHGRWAGVQPFDCTNRYEELPIAVLTRATIRTNKLYSFWKQVPKVSQSIVNCEGQLFAKGIGELPFVQQATFSLWQDEASMKLYAYHNKAHREVIQKKVQGNWYKEELFVRLQPIAVEGGIFGVNPLQKYFE